MLQRGHILSIQYKPVVQMCSCVGQLPMLGGLSCVGQHPWRGLSCMGQCPICVCGHSCLGQRLWGDAPAWVSARGKPLLHGSAPMMGGSSLARGELDL